MYDNFPTQHWIFPENQKWEINIPNTYEIFPDHINAWKIFIKYPNMNILEIFPVEFSNTALDISRIFPENRR